MAMHLATGIPTQLLDFLAMHEKTWVNASFIKP
jgi:hypothetical protein